jgi:uncharacterized protein YkwD
LGTINLIFQAKAPKSMILAYLLASSPAIQAPVPSTSTLLQAAAPIAAPSTQDVIAEINKARSNPSAYADWLETLRPYYNENVLSLPGEDRIRTQSGTIALDSAITFLRQLQPLPPLTHSPGMSRGAQDHINDPASN